MQLRNLQLQKEKKTVTEKICCYYHQKLHYSKIELHKRVIILLTLNLHFQASYIPHSDYYNQHMQAAAAQHYGYGGGHAAAYNPRKI